MLGAGGGGVLGFMFESDSTSLGAGGCTSEIGLVTGTEPD